MVGCELGKVELTVRREILAVASSSLQSRPGRQGHVRTDHVLWGSNQGPGIAGPGPCFDLTSPQTAALLTAATQIAGTQLHNPSCIFFQSTLAHFKDLLPSVHAAFDNFETTKFSFLSLIHPPFETFLKWATEGRRQNAATTGRDSRQKGEARRAETSARASPEPRRWPRQWQWQRC